MQMGAEIRSGDRGQDQDRVSTARHTHDSGWWSVFHESVVPPKDCHLCAEGIWPASGTTSHIIRSSVRSSIAAPCSSDKVHHAAAKFLDLTGWLPSCQSAMISTASALQISPFPASSSKIPQGQMILLFHRGTKDYQGHWWRVSETVSSVWTGTLHVSSSWSHYWMSSIVSQLVIWSYDPFPELFVCITHTRCRVITTAGKGQINWNHDKCFLHRPKDKVKASWFWGVRIQVWCMRKHATEVGAVVWGCVCGWLCIWSPPRFVGLIITITLTPMRPWELGILKSSEK